MKKTRWTEEEDRYLKEKYNTEELRIMSKEIRRTFSAIRKRVTFLKISKAAKYSQRRLWTSDEDKYLRDNLQTRSIAEIADAIGRSIYAVVSRIDKRDMKSTIKQSKAIDVRKTQPKYNPSKLEFKNLEIHQKPFVPEQIICNFSIKQKSFHFWGGLQFDNTELTPGYKVMIPQNYKRLLKIEKRHSESKSEKGFNYLNLELLKHNNEAYLVYIQAEETIKIMTFNSKGVILHKIPDIGLPRTAIGTAVIGNIDRIHNELIEKQIMEAA